jgi:hypothetical protein
MNNSEMERPVVRKKKPNVMCIESSYMEGLKKRPSFEVYVKTLYGIKPRDFCFVDISGKRYLADVITGSLYDTFTGECMSTHQLKLVSKTHHEQA